MSSELVAALLGAVVAFAGTYLLQRSQFRRAEVDDLKQRLGLVRALRADLHIAKLACEMSLHNEVIPSGTKFPVDLWGSDGHRIIGLIHAPAESALVDAFGRMGLINGMLAAMPGPSGVSLKETEEDSEDEAAIADSLKQLITKIDLAVTFLDALQAGYEKRERLLCHPIRTRLAQR